MVFHCALSQQRGPGAARRYLEVKNRMGKDQVGEEGDKDREEEGKGKEQEVWVLDGGFVKWQERYGNDERLTEDYKPDIWNEY